MKNVEHRRNGVWNNEDQLLCNILNFWPGGHYFLRTETAEMQIRDLIAGFFELVLGHCKSFLAG